MERINPDYDKGYFQAMLNFYDFIDSLDKDFKSELKSKKKYHNCVVSALKLLLDDKIIYDEFKTYGSFNYSDLLIDKNTGELKKSESKDRKN